MKIYFLAGRCLPIESTSLEKRPLGGTETGIIRVSECLSALGHQVTVFTSHPSPESAANPRYLPARLMLEDPHCDIAIAVQDWWPLVGYPIKAQRYLFWTGDAGDQFLTFGIGDKRVASRIDTLLTVSKWHQRHLTGVSGFPIEKSAVIYNGVHVPWYENSLPKKPKRIIFTTTPYRGLALTVAIIKELVVKHPDLEYHVYSGLAVYDRDKAFNGPQVQEFENISAQLGEIPQCRLFGNVKQEQLAQALLEASIFLYPSIFPESSSIATLEALAAGCVPVVSDLAALSETVGDAGIAIPLDNKAQAAFVTTLDELLSNPERARELAERGKARIKAQHSWSKVTERLLAIIAPQEKN